MPCPRELHDVGWRWQAPRLASGSAIRAKFSKDQPTLPPKPQATSRPFNSIPHPAAASPVPSIRKGRPKVASRFRTTHPRKSEIFPKDFTCTNPNRFRIMPAPSIENKKEGNVQRHQLHRPQITTRALVLTPPAPPSSRTRSEPFRTNLEPLRTQNRPKKD